MFLLILFSQLEAKPLQPIIKYQSMETSWKPTDEELVEPKIKVPRVEEDMEVDEMKKESFKFGSVVFKTKDVKEEVIKQEKPWLPSLFTLATGTNSLTFSIFYDSIQN